MAEPSGIVAEPPPGIVMTEPPYGIIADAIKNGAVVPFLGAGANYGARPQNVRWDATRDFLPDGVELSRHLAERSRFPSNQDFERTDLAKVASYYVESAGSREDLRSVLRSIFNRDYEPAGIHKCLAQLTRITQPMLIVTTNYDDMTERAFADQQFSVVTHLTDDDEWAGSVLLSNHDPGQKPEPQPVDIMQLGRHIDLTKRTVIYKMHGAVDRQFVPPKWDSYVITEDDYVDFLSQMAKKSAVPPTLIEHCGMRRFLFLGYGLRDWNFRVVLRDLLANRSKRLGMSWAVQKDVRQLEHDLWVKRGVLTCTADIRDFAQKLLREFGLGEARSIAGVGGGK